MLGISVSLLAGVFVMVTLLRQNLPVTEPIKVDIITIDAGGVLGAKKFWMRKRLSQWHLVAFFAGVVGTVCIYLNLTRVIWNVHCRSYSISLY
jgi:hypothetical protein